LELAFDGNIAEVRKKLRTQPALLNIRDGDGRTPLHHAAQSGNMALCNLLLELGADVNESNVGGHIPLHFAAFSGHCEAIIALLEAGAGIDHQGLDGSVPLHFACGQGQLEAVRLLVAKGANLKVTNFSGHLPLHWAVQNKHNVTAKAVNEMYTHPHKVAPEIKKWPRKETVLHEDVHNKPLEKTGNVYADPRYGVDTYLDEKYIPRFGDQPTGRGYT